MAERASDAAFHDINGEELLQETCGHVAVEHRRFRGDLQRAQDANACGPGKKARPVRRAVVGRLVELHEKLLRHYLAVFDFVGADLLELDAPASLHRDIHCQCEGDGVAGDQRR